MPLRHAESGEAWHAGPRAHFRWVLFGIGLAWAEILLAAGGAMGGDRSSELGGSVESGARSVDPVGLSTLTPDRRRTPTGLLYPYPLERPTYSGTDPQLRGYVELGWLFSRGDEGETRFREYLDAGDGPWIRRFGFEGRSREGLGHLVFEGGSVGRSDQFYRFEAGQVNRVRLRASYDALEHTYADDARILFTGVGGERLNLPAGLVAGQNTSAELEAALATVGQSRISQSRNESGVDLRARLLSGLNWVAAYRLERRDGERPYGGTLGTTFGSTNSGSVVETLEPIHSRTHNWSTGFEFSSDRLQANLAYHGSFFDNRRESLTWENPFYAVDLGFLQISGEPLGRMALAPDNTSHRISADVAMRTPLLGRFTASAAWTRMEQDERLLPATINPNVTDFQDLSRTRANARVDLLLVQARWRARPLPPLSISLGARFLQRDSDTQYVSVNPTTGVYGYVVEDLTATGRVGAARYSYRRVRIDVDGRWKITRHSKIGVEFEHDIMHRSGRARRETTDDRVRLHLTTRAPPGSTLRVGYEFQKRTGSSYDPARDNKHYLPEPGSAALVGPARSLQSYRQFDLARHVSHAINLRSNWIVGKSSDIALTGRYLDRDYGAGYGLQDERVAELTLDGTFQPSPTVDLHAFVSFEWRSRRFSTINSEPGPVGDLSPGGATFPFDNRWSWDSEAETYVVGAGIRLRPIESLEFEIDYRFQASDERIDTDFDRTGGALSGVTDPATAAMNYSALRMRDHLLQISVTRDWSDAIATSLLYRLQASEFQDQQQSGIRPLVNQNLFLAHQDDDYTVHVMGVTATLRY